MTKGKSVLIGSLELGSRPPSARALRRQRATVAQVADSHPLTVERTEEQHRTSGGKPRTGY